MPITLFRHLEHGPSFRVVEESDVRITAAAPRSKSLQGPELPLELFPLPKIIGVQESDQFSVSFLNPDVNNIVTDRPFDAVVGRFILMFLPDPIFVLRSVSRLVRPGGVLAFQEPSWIPMLALGDRLPLWSCVLRSIHETILRSGANPEMGLALYPIFQELGLPAPKMHLAIPLGSDVDFLRVISDLVCSLRPLAEQHNVSLEELGGLDTLPDRICAEIAAANTVVSIVPLVGVWSRKPADSQGSAE